nr:hypothetical protein [Tanacetum cinerariifolium]
SFSSGFRLISFIMTSIQRKIKHKIRPPKRYEDSISSINKRNNNDLENSSDENSKDDMGKNELKTSSQQDLDTGDIGVGLKEVNNENKNELNDVKNDKKQNMNIEEGDELRNDKECLDKEIKNGVEGSGSKNGVNGSVYADFTNGIGDILFGTVSPIDALSADKIDIPVGNIGIKLHQKNAPSTSANRNYANAEPGKIPIWRKLSNIPLEAWSVKGISALSSRLGKPLVMDDMTASMCHNGLEGLHMLDSTCCVFGHSNSNCHKNGVNIDKQDENKKYQRKQDEEGFIEVRGRKNVSNGNGTQRMKEQNNKKEYKVINEKDKGNIQYIMSNRGNEPHSKKIWNVGNKNVEELKKSAKWYAVLEDDKEGMERNDRIKDRRLEVDKFISEQRQPTSNDTKDWTFDMKEYFKCRWDELQRKKYVIESESDTDIECEVNEAAKNLVANEINGVHTEVLFN